MTFFSALGQKQGYIAYFSKWLLKTSHLFTGIVSNFSLFRALACINQEKENLHVNSSPRIDPHKELESCSNTMVLSNGVTVGFGFSEVWWFFIFYWGDAFGDLDPLWDKEVSWSRVPTLSFCVYVCVYTCVCIFNVTLTFSALVLPREHLFTNLVV